MMVDLSPLSSTLTPLFEHHIFFQYLAKNMFQRLFYLLTHLIHSLGSMSTNTLITMHLRLLFNTLSTVILYFYWWIYALILVLICLLSYNLFLYLYAYSLLTFVVPVSNINQMIRNSNSLKIF